MFDWLFSPPLDVPEYTPEERFSIVMDRLDELHDDIKALHLKLDAMRLTVTKPESVDVETETSSSVESRELADDVYSEDDFEEDVPEKDGGEMTRGAPLESPFIKDTTKIE